MSSLELFAIFVQTVPMLLFDESGVAVLASCELMVVMTLSYKSVFEQVPCCSESVTACCTEGPSYGDYWGSSFGLGLEINDVWSHAFGQDDACCTDRVAIVCMQQLYACDMTVDCESEARVSSDAMLLTNRGIEGAIKCDSGTVVTVIAGPSSQKTGDWPGGSTTCFEMSAWTQV